jgi:hypothetical protein
MPKFNDRPTVKRFRERIINAHLPTSTSPLDPEWLRHLCLQAGADDVGFVESSPEGFRSNRNFSFCDPAIALIIFQGLCF